MGWRDTNDERRDTRLGRDKERTDHEKERSGMERAEIQSLRDEKASRSMEGSKGPGLIARLIVTRLFTLLSFGPPYTRPFGLRSET